MHGLCCYGAGDYAIIFVRAKSPADFSAALGTAAVGADSFILIAHGIDVGGWVMHSYFGTIITDGFAWDSIILNLVRGGGRTGVHLSIEPLQMA